MNVGLDCVLGSEGGDDADLDGQRLDDGGINKREGQQAAIRHRRGDDAGHVQSVAMAALTNPKLKERIGWLAYISPILQAAFRNEKRSLTVVLEDGQRAKRRQHTAVIGNCGVLTGGFLLMPEAKLDDGLLDVLALDPKSVFGWTRILRRVAVGSALRNSPNKSQILRGLPDITSMRYRQTPRVEWHMDEPVLVQIDGDTFGEVSSAVVTAIPRCLTVRVAGD